MPPPSRTADTQSRILGDAQIIIRDGKISKRFKTARAGRHVTDRPGVDGGRVAVMKERCPVARGEQLRRGPATHWGHAAAACPLSPCPPSHALLPVARREGRQLPRATPSRFSEMLQGFTCLQPASEINTDALVLGTHLS